MISLVSTVRSFGQIVSDFITRSILTLVYFVLLTPIALWQRWQRKPYTPSAEGTESFWSVREPDIPTMESARKAY